MSFIDVGRVVRKGGSRASATGFALGAGWHTDPFGGADRALWLTEGPSLLAALRHDRRLFSLELRLGVERDAAIATQSGLEIENHVFSPSLAAILPIDLRTFTLGIGVRGGMAFVRQRFTATAMHPGLVTVPSRAEIPTRWANGLEAGVLGQLDVPVGQHAFLRVETGLDLRAFKVTPYDHPIGAQVHLVGAAGLAF
jgi:hypothetical protein